MVAVEGWQEFKIRNWDNCSNKLRYNILNITTIIRLIWLPYFQFSHLHHRKRNNKSFLISPRFYMWFFFLLSKPFNLNKDLSKVLSVEIGELEEEGHAFVRGYINSSFCKHLKIRTQSNPQILALFNVFWTWSLSLSPHRLPFYLEFLSLPWSITDDETPQ